MNKLILPLITTALLLIGIAMWVSCVTTPDATDAEYRDRFTFTRFEPRESNCMVHVITDKVTGCQYLQVCNDVTSMPHTCFLDRTNQ